MNMIKRHTEKWTGTYWLQRANFVNFYSRGCMKHIYRVVSPGICVPALRCATNTPSSLTKHVLCGYQGMIKAWLWVRQHKSTLHYYRQCATNRTACMSERLSTTWMLLSGNWIIVIVISARKGLVPLCHISSWLKVPRQQGEVSDVFTLFSAMATGISTEWP